MPPEIQHTILDYCLSSHTGELPILNRVCAAHIRRTIYRHCNLISWEKATSFFFAVYRWNSLSKLVRTICLSFPLPNEWKFQFWALFQNVINACKGLERLSLVFSHFYGCKSLRAMSLNYRNGEYGVPDDDTIFQNMFSRRSNDPITLPALVLVPMHDELTQVCPH